MTNAGTMQLGRSRGLGNRPRLWLIAAAAALLLAGCATAPDPSDVEAVAEYNETNDPAEPSMRAVFAFNQALDHTVLKPVASVYREVVPEKARAGVHNVLNNLRTPVIFFNDVLQGDFERALATLIRFLVNSTAGIFGLNDTAADLGIEFHNEDFGQTLAVWGLNEGPYVMLPVFGPSNPRDVVGRVVDFLIDPLNMWAGNTQTDWLPPSHTAATAVNFRTRHYDEIEDLERSSLDFYAAVRSLYRQRRNDEIHNGDPSPVSPIPSIGMFEEENGDAVAQPNQISRSD